MELVVPVNVCIKRFYRAYAHVDIDATDDEIRQAITEGIVKNQEAYLNDDPDLEIEAGDIEVVEIDHDEAWIE